MSRETFAVSGSQAKLLKAGFLEVGQTGSHIKFAKITDSETRTTIVPRHREVSGGTLRSILRQAGLSESEFGKF